MKKPELPQNIKEMINLNRLEILEETDSAYRVRYGDKEYIIKKDEESYFIGDNGTTHQGLGLGLGLSLRLELKQIISPGIFQDDDAPRDFKEVMMFHEIREKEYSEADFEDAHNRAVHDEILYVFKFLPPEKQTEYFEFVKNYRVKTMQILKLKQWGGYLEDALEELKNDKEVVMEAVRDEWRALEYASEELRGDKELVMEAVRNDGRALEYASEELRGDKELVMEAVRDRGEALGYASKELQKDPELRKLAED